LVVMNFLIFVVAEEYPYGIWKRNPFQFTLWYWCIYMKRDAVNISKSVCVT
jgi:hypothetical protein